MIFVLSTFHRVYRIFCCCCLLHIMRCAILYTQTVVSVGYYTCTNNVYIYYMTDEQAILYERIELTLCNLNLSPVLSMSILLSLSLSLAAAAACVSACVYTCIAHTQQRHIYIFKVHFERMRARKKSLARDRARERERRGTEIK